MKWVVSSIARPWPTAFRLWETHPSASGCLQKKSEKFGMNSQELSSDKSSVAFFPQHHHHPPVFTAHSEPRRSFRKSQRARREKGSVPLVGSSKMTKFGSPKDAKHRLKCMLILGNCSIFLLQNSIFIFQLLWGSMHPSWKCQTHREFALHAAGELRHFVVGTWRKLSRAPTGNVSKASAEPESPAPSFLILGTCSKSDVWDQPEDLGFFASALHSEADAAAPLCSERPFRRPAKAEKSSMCWTTVRA